jgi:type I restriction enzyme S subunit
MSWQEVALGSAIHIKHGYSFKSQYFGESGKYIVLTPGNFREEGGFRLRPGKDRSYTGDFPESFVLSEGDLIIAMTEQGPGLLGSAALVPEDAKFLHNQRLGLIDSIDSSKLDRHFLYYLFNTKPVRSQISGSASGTKVHHTAPDRIYRIRVNLPEVHEQERIASALSAYDDLIENNRRRIQLLEQAARLLYKEWFVYLRFPGHEHVKIVDGVPHGWSRRPLGEIGKLNYGKALKADDRVPGPFPVYGSSGQVGTHEKPLVEGPGIIVGRKGNVGNVYWSETSFFPIDTVYFVNSGSANLFLYYALLHTAFISTDVAVPGLNREYAHSRDILVPESSLLNLFEASVKPCHSQITVLEKYNEALSAARDLLLPRLMNGEISL